MRRNKNWIKAYLEYTKSSEAPEAFHIWTAISTIAGVLQRKVFIEENIFQWTPNFYIILVGPAGVVTKSTSIGLGTDLLKEVEGVTMGPNSLTWQAMTMALEEAQVARPKEPGNLESELTYMSCMTCSVSELGTFLDPRDGKLVSVLTDLWDGRTGSWEHMTKTTGSTNIMNPWINIIAGTTPTWLKNNFPESMIGEGLTSRIVFVYGQQKRQYVAYPHLVRHTDDHQVLRDSLVHDLREINKLQGAYRLTEEAEAWGAAWYEQHHVDPSELLKGERFEGYRARKQTHLHKLAIILAAAIRDELKVTSKDLQLADKMISLLERDMLKVFQSIGATEESKNLHSVIKILMVNDKTMGQNQLYMQLASFMTVKDYNEAIDAGVKIGYIQLTTANNSVIVKLIQVPENFNTGE